MVQLSIHALISWFNNLQIGENSLILASKLGMENIVLELLKYKPDLNEAALVRDLTVVNQNFTLTRRIILQGGSSALMNAVVEGHSRVVQLLLNNNADSSFGSRAVSSMYCWFAK